MTELTEVFYFPTDAGGNEAGAPVRIGLNEDGSADLSGLPENMRATYERFGAGDPIAGRFTPKDGKKFLWALLQYSSPYKRFRSNAA
jgi:hypothetical protein